MRLLFLFLIVGISTTACALHMQEYQSFKQQWLSKNSDKGTYGAQLVATVEFGAKKGFFDVMAKAYNLLRELHRIPLALSSSKIDRVWVEQIGYRSFKAYLDSAYVQYLNNEFRSKKLFMILQLEHWHNQLVKQHDEYAVILLKVYKRYTYRYFCELHGQRPQVSDTGLTASWIALAKKKTIVAALKEKYKPLTGAMLAQAQKVQRECGIRKEIIYLRYNELRTGLIEGIHYMTVQEEKPYFRLFALYHEMAHIVHNDLNDNSSTYQTRMQHPSYKGDIARISRFIELGKHSIPQKTQLGAYLEQVKHQYATFWSKPKDLRVYQTMLYIRAKEQRADLYALEKLAQKRRYDVLIEVVYHFGMSSFIVAQEANDHPSNIERAFYMLGYLASRGVNIQDLALNYERTHSS